MKKISIIGGDSRQIYLKKKLLSDGFDVVSNFLEDDDSEIINESDIYILPVPSLNKEGNINITKNKVLSLNEIKPKLDKADLVICAKLDGYTDICVRDDFCYYNAIPTAEGAVLRLLQNTPYTLYGKNVLVTGFGRVSKILLSRLSSFGCSLTATYRKASVCANIEAMNYSAISVFELPRKIKEFDIIFNTVEAPILNKDLLKNCKKTVYISDLASFGNGVDTLFAKSIGLNAEYLPALPGKVAPESAGEILYKTVKNIFFENDIKG